MTPLQVKVRKKVDGPEILAQKVLTEQVIQTREGPRTAHIGDWLMTGIEGEQWPIPHDEFMSNYKTVGATEDRKQWKVVAIPKTRYAYQTHVPFDFTWGGEDFHAEPGDWIISDPALGKQWPCGPTQFEASYEIVG